MIRVIAKESKEEPRLQISTTDSAIRFFCPYPAFPTEPQRQMSTWLLISLQARPEDWVWTKTLKAACDFI